MSDDLRGQEKWHLVDYGVMMPGVGLRYSGREDRISYVRDLEKAIHSCYGSMWEIDGRVKKRPFHNKMFVISFLG